MRRIVALTALVTVVVFGSGNFSAPARAQQGSTQQSSSAAPKAIVIAEGARLADIRGIAVDAGGNVFISSEASPAPSECVARDVAAHISVAIFSNCASAQGEDPSGIAVTRDGSRVFLANQAQNSVRLLDMTSGKVSLEPRANSRTTQSPSVTGADASQFTLASPAGLAADGAENLYVADRGNNRVLRLVTGGRDFSPVAHILDAAAVTVDPTGSQVFIASPASNRIFKIDAATGDIAVFAGTGAVPETAADSAGQFPAPSAATQAALAAPEGIAVDAAGNVFIADTGANAILRVDAKTNLISRVALGAELSSPGALAIDRRGNLFVADRGNHRVVEFAGVAQAATSGSVTLTPSSLDFGDQPTGGATPQQTFTLTNGSSSALSFSTNSFAFTGNDPNDFMQTNNCVPQLAAGGSCQIFVTFAPQGTGARAATLTVTDADPSSPQTAALTGTGDTFALTAANQNATMQTVVPGDSGNYSLSVTPDNVFGGTVTLSCPTRLPDPTLTCSINPSQLTITPGQASQFSVTITTLSGKTPAATAFRVLPPRGLRNSGKELLLGFLGFSLAVMAIMLWRRGREEVLLAFDFCDSTRRRRAWAISALALLCAAGVAGCYHAPARYNPVTPAAIFTINIAGTAQNASRAITLTLNVE